MIDISQLADNLVKGIAYNLGWEEDELIEPYLEKIAQMTPEQALGRYSEWHLGDAGWARTFVNHIDQLRKAETKSDYILATEVLELSRSYPGDSYQIKIIKALRAKTGCDLKAAYDKANELFIFDKNIRTLPEIRRS